MARAAPGAGADHRDSHDSRRTLPQRPLDFPEPPWHIAAMRKRAEIALAVLLLGVIGVIGWQALRVQDIEPVVAGRPLTQWVENYVNGAPGKSTEEADRALREAGTNAIPVLLRMLREKESPFRRQMMGLLRMQKVVQVHYTPVERRNQAAYFAFLRLGGSGTGAELAVPQLMEIYQERISPFARQCAAMSLGAYGPAARSAIPVLLRGLADTNVLVRCDTLNGLGHIRADPELVVPALAKALNDPVPKVRLFACMALSQQAQEAKPAAPALAKALNDSDSGVRFMAANALKAIDPEAAARAGVK